MLTGWWAPGGTPDAGARAGRGTDPDQDDRPDDPGPGPSSRVAAARVAAVAVIVGLATRWWLIASRRPSWWNDSDDYRAAARHGWWTLDLWAGERAVAVPALLKVAGGGDLAFVRLQVAVAAVCWAVLAYEVARTARSSATRWTVAAFVTAFSLAAPLTMWDRSVLSESLSLSALALAVGALVRLQRRTTWGSAAAGVVAVAGLALARDTHAWVVLCGTVIAGVVGGYRRARGRPVGPRPLVAFVLLAGVTGALVIAAADHGERQAFPTRNVLQARILPYPERVEWFAAHGMPQADRFLGLDRLAPYVEEGAAPVTYVAEDDPAFAAWNRWVASDGPAAFRLWVLTHPTYLLTEPRHDPERAFNNAAGDRSFYAAVDQRVVPFLGEVFLPSRPLGILAAIGLAAAAWARRGPHSPALGVGVVTLVLALPHAALAWHADAMETARHLVVPVVQLHLGVLLLAVDVLVAREVAREVADAAMGDGDAQDRSNPPELAGGRGHPLP